MYEQNVIQVLEPSKIISVAWKWLTEKEVTVKALPDYDIYKSGQLDDTKLVEDVWKVLDEADIVIAHNGDSFDIKKLNSRFIAFGLTAPSPYKTIDTLKVAKKYFKFDNNSLEQLGDYLKEGHKAPTGGFSLWTGCIAGDKEAWTRMKIYNARDVELLERVYLRLRPFITNHPNVNQDDASNGYSCPTCTSHNTSKRGFTMTLTGRKQRYQCMDCGAWSTGSFEKVYPQRTNTS